MSTVLQSPQELCDLLGIPFSAQQIAAITADLAPGVIIAGAGSGKTTVMAARVVWLVGTGQVRPEEVLGLTFTRKAAAELASRVQTALDRAGLTDPSEVDETGEQLIMTYDAFAARVVKDHGLRLGVEADGQMITGATRYRLAERVVRTAAGPFSHISRLVPSTLTARVVELESQLRQHLITEADLDRHAGQFRQQLLAAPVNRQGNVYSAVQAAVQTTAERLELASLVQEYVAEKRRRGLVEFADQMALAADLAVTVPSVSASLRESYKVVLLDEYQDTSSAQATMLQGLFSGPDVESGRGHPVTAVGDPFQAIYGWRGAAASNITQFAHDFPCRDGEPATSFALTVNRRSGTAILDAANTLAEPLRQAQASLEGEVALGDTRLVAPPGTVAGEVGAATFRSWPEEKAWLVGKIIELGPTQAHRRWSDIAVLTRRNADLAELYNELTAHDVPAEIVGLGGLLELPEVQDVVATLKVIEDVTANPEVVRLLTGPRWSIGPSDLAALGRRARRLSAQGRTESVTALQPHQQLHADFATGHGTEPLLDGLATAVAEVDPTEVISLLDALEQPGPGPYSDRAREVFAQFSHELAELRRHSDEPVLDVVRRVIAMVGVEIELEATPELHRSQRRNQLAKFVEAVADYVDVDAEASLSGMLAWLHAEQETGVGLEQAVPSDEDSVKLLTIHKSKGLEWDVVVLPALVDQTFPSDRVTANYVTAAAVVPAPLRGDAGSIPQVRTPVSAENLDRYKKALQVENRQAEDRLAYVAVTRARRMLIATGHHWRQGLQKPRKFSDYLLPLLATAAHDGLLFAQAPEPVDTENPLLVDTPRVAWPQPWDGDGWERRQRAAQWVEHDRVRLRSVSGAHDSLVDSDHELLLDDWARVHNWDLDISRLVAEAKSRHQPRTEVAVPPVMSTSAWLRAVADPVGFATDLVRPMPRQPSRSARFGSRFHRWIERHFAATALVELADWEVADDEETSEAELTELCDAFAAGQFGERKPHLLEAPIEFRLAGRTIRGRIDAVFREGEDWLVVDWKTSVSKSADPLQLAIYRLAWAEVMEVDPVRVRAGFYYVRRDELVVLADLPDSAELTRRLHQVQPTESSDFPPA